MKTRSFFVGALLATCVAFGRAQQAGVESHFAAQSAADYMKELAGADGALLPAGMVKSSYSRDDLSTLVQFPDDEIVVVRLKGSEIRLAFERSITLYPQSNTSFLQVSGFEISFDPKADPNARIRGVMVGAAKLDDAKEYQIAMPSSLGRGGYGAIGPNPHDQGAAPIVGIVPRTNDQNAGPFRTARR